MTLLMRDQENREEGRKEGMLEEKMRFVKTLLQDGSFSCEKIASVTQVPLEKVLELKTEQIYTVTIQTDVNGS